MAASEASLAALSKLMGNRRIATTIEVYGHLYEDDAEDDKLLDLGGGSGAFPGTAARG